jgi:homoserine dehydrogenase
MVVALLGHGTVGGGVYELLKNRSDITVKYVLDRSPIAELGAVSVTDFSTILNDGEVDTVVEVMGGLEPAHGYMVAAMRAGKNIVTANKHLLAAYYDELTTLAKETGIGFRTSAAVGGGIPWLPNLQRLKRIGAVNEVCGIMNGTTNYILSTMHKKGYDYESVLRDAQSFGYAEADTTADIEGYDIQRKLMISANIAFDARLTEQQVPAAGIAGITREDIAGFNEMGYVCKLYATAKRVADGAILAVVEPTLFKAETLEAAVPANYNLITAVSEYAGRQSFFGEGAGRWPTAAAVVQDLLDLCERKQGFYTQLSQPLPSNNMCEERRYYVRYIVDTWFMDGCVEKRWGNGVLTRPVSPAQMHSWYVEARSNDPGIFFAALQG